MKFSLFRYLFCVVWICGNYAQREHNLWLDPQNDEQDFITYDVQIECDNDGYYDTVAKKCQCKSYFSDANCRTRDCQNSGVLLNQGFDRGCQCPPGFLGTACEPVRCVAGESNSYYGTKPEKNIVLFITYNNGLVKNMLDLENGSDNVTQPICSNSINSGASTLNFYVGNLNLAIRDINNISLDDCQDLFDQFMYINECPDDDGKNCPASTSLKTSDLLTSIQQTSPNSKFFIVTNELPENNTDNINEILRLAIAKRITIHVFDVSISSGSNPGHLALKTLAEGTLGVYSTPYDDHTNALRGSNNVRDTINKIFELDMTGYGVAYNWLPGVSFFTNSINVGTGDFYISMQLNSSSESDQLSDICDVKIPAIDTGMYMMYKCKKTGGTTLFKSLSVTSQAYLYANTALNGYAAITTSDEVDAHAPYAFVESTTNYTLVGRLSRQDGSTVPADQVQLVRAINPNAALRPQPLQPQPREGCQFNVKLANITCSAPGPFTLIMSDRDSYTAAVPFMCVDTAKIRNYKAKIDEYSYSEDIYAADSNETVLTCDSNTDEYPELLQMLNNRAFGIASRNGPFNTSVTNGFDFIYVRESSIFYPLVNYIMGKGIDKLGMLVFKQFAANIYNNASLYNIVQNSDFGYLQTMIMTQRCLNNTDLGSFYDPDNPLYNATCPDDDDIPNDLSNALYYLIDEMDKNHPYSDVFFIIDYKNPNDPNNITVDGHEYLIDQLHHKRSRLYIIFVQEAHNFTYDEWNNANNLARRSGGAAFRLNGYPKLNEFFNTYYSTLVTADTVFQAIRPLIPYMSIGPFYLRTNGTYTLLAVSDPTSDVVFTRPSNVTILRNGSPVNWINSSNYIAFGELTVIPIDTSGISDNYDDVYTIAVTYPGITKNVVLTLVEIESPYFINLAFASSNKIDTDSYGNWDSPFYYPVVGCYTKTVNYSTGVVRLSITQTPSGGGYVQIYNETMQTRDECAFNWYADYKFVCNDPGSIYHFTIQALFPDEKLGLTRTQILTCPGGGENGHCVNGGTPQGDLCICATGYTGKFCENPICQNGGSLLASKICNCTNGYTGNFCERAPDSMTCKNGPNIPDFNSKLTSLIFVVDQALLDKTDQKLITEDDYRKDFPGSQIAVIQYKEGAYPQLTLSTMNMALLKDAINTPANLTPVPVPTPTGSTPMTTTPQEFSTTTMPIYTTNYASPYPALNLAIDSMVGDRALIVLVANDTTNSPVDPNFINKLSASRVELRIFTRTGDNTDSFTNLLATLGNGVPFTALVDKFDNYFRNYIIPLFPIATGSNRDPQPLLNVVETQGVGCPYNNTIIIPKDTNDNENTPYTFFIHGRYINIVAKPEYCNLTVGSNDDGCKNEDSCIFACYLSSPEKFNVQLYCNSTISGYSIEMLNYVHTAYGFRSGSDSTMENLNLGLVFGDNVMSITPEYSVPNAVSVANMPSVYLREILYDGSLGDLLEQPSSKKTVNCTYQYYTPTISCSENIIGYQAQIRTRSADTYSVRQQQVVLACANANSAAISNETFCVHGVPNASSGLCDCESAWEGVDCSQPICKYGARHAHSCNCPYFETGSDCSVGTYITTTVASTTVTTVSPTTGPTTITPGSRAFVFIVDIVGNDPIAFNSSTDAILKFCARYQSQSVLIMTIGSDGRSASPFTTLNMGTLRQTLINFGLNRTNNGNSTPLLDYVFEGIWNHVNAAQDEGYVIQLDFTGKANNIFYLSEVGGNITDDTKNGSLKNLMDRNFKIISIAMSRYFTTSSPNVIDEMGAFSNVTGSADNSNAALKIMSDDSNVTPDYTEGPTARYPSCVFNVHMNIILWMEFRNTTVPFSQEYDDEKRRNKLLDFADMFRSDFNIGNNYRISCVDANSTLCKDYSYVTGFGMSGAQWMGDTPQFCASSNWVKFRTAIASPSSWKYNQSANFTANNNAAKIAYLLSDDASNYMCGRSKEEDVQHFVIWFPTEAVNDSNKELSNSFTNNSVYNHIIIPQYYNPEANDLYYNLAEVTRTRTKNVSEPLLTGKFESENATDLVQEVWTILCRFAGVIPTDSTATAEPPGPLPTNAPGFFPPSNLDEGEYEEL